MFLLPLKSNLEQLKARLSDPKFLNASNAEQLKGLLGAFRGVRKQSAYEFLGMPLYSIAYGPDLEKGEFHGHAKGVFAYGDVATGIVAVGGFAKGVVAIGAGAIGVVAMGGLALGLVTFGGLALGLVFAVGGAALGLVACGGVALGAVAVGGVAVGHYAAGGVAYGTHLWDAIHKDPEAIAFFSQWKVLLWLVRGM